MPLSFDNALASLLHGLLRPELDFLCRLPFWAPALTGVAVALAVAVLMLAWSRSCPSSLCTPGVGALREEAVGLLRRAKAELKGWQGEAAVAAVLARAGYPALHDVIVRDAWGLTQVDHLVRLAGGIAVVETKAYSGTVTGGVRDRLWVQELACGRVRTAFRNPVMQNERHVRAVRRVTGSGVPVCGLVVSAGSARFCGELEGGVVGLDVLAARLRAGPMVGCDMRQLDAAWRALTAAAARSGPLRGAHLRQVERVRRRAGAG